MTCSKVKAAVLVVLGIVLFPGFTSAWGSAAPTPTAPATQPPGGGAPTASQLLARMASCTQISTGLYATDAGLPATIPICGANGAVWFRADLDIDCDGVTTPECNLQTDPTYQNDTSLHTSTGQPFNAATMPYVVIPGVSSRWSHKSANIDLGAVVAVIYNGKVEYGVFADTGPPDIIGEASFAMAKALGVPDPSTGGIDESVVTYLVFKGSQVSPVESHAAAVSIGQALAQEFLNNNGTGPTMSLDKTSLVFSAVNSGTAFSAKTSPQTVRLTQTGAGTVTWTAASTAPWLVVAPTSGSGSTTLTISTQFASGLLASQTGRVDLTFTGAGNTAGPITVTLASLVSGTTAAPTGSFDTPTDGTTGVTGSVAVTGWAMDDVEVTGVRILRDPVGGEPAGTLVLVGNAVFVDGARPDVQAAFPASPRNSRAGWGYLMLTNFLPNLGNGTFKLTAIADDADGHSAVLGTKTITCSNSTATAPTGAIDTPAQGGTVSGTVTNFGWVLSPNPRRADPPGGGVVRVAIDGALMSAVPSGWTSRSDLTALFPAAQFPGVATALGVAGFDSTALASGVHTISWVVTDNLGSASGIGSRYFTVANGSLFLDPAQGPVTNTGSTVVAGTTSFTAEIEGAPVDVAAISGRRGFALDTPLQAYGVHSGRPTVQSEELDRIELHLRETAADHYAGYLRVGGGLAPLPVGSLLDASTGVFTWMPGVGFVGTYDLVFVRWSGALATARQEVRVVLNPKGSNRVGPQTVIDSPSQRAHGPASVGQSFLLAGWAADLDSTVDRGVDTVHAWAYPATGGAPLWLGAATFGGARPDVAAVYGDRFLTTGYGITVSSLAPGTYDLAVFAWSTVTGGFVPAKTVRVTVR